MVCVARIDWETHIQLKIMYCATGFDTFVYGPGSGPVPVTEILPEFYTCSLRLWRLSAMHLHDVSCLESRIKM